MIIDHDGSHAPRRASVKRLTAAVAAALTLLAAADASASVKRSAQPFLGVTYWQFFQSVGDSTSPIYPREIAVNVLEIDTSVAGVSFRMQPGNGALPGEVTRSTTRSFVNSIGAQMGINGDFFDTNPPYASQNGQFFTDVTYVGASNGDVYSTANGGESLFNVAANGTPGIFTAGAAGSITTTGGTALYNAIGGNQRILKNGAISAPNDSYTTTLNPHTAIGVSQDNKKVFLLTIDGRQTDYSEGMFTTEMAQVLLDLGAYNAINLDGGGSTTMVMDDSNDGTHNARLVNSPSDNSSSTVPGTERLVANNLAVFATPNPSYVPLAAIPRPGTSGVQPLFTTLTVFDDFEGSKGNFASTVSFSGSNRNVDAASSSTLDTTVKFRNASSLRVDVVNNGTAASPNLKLRFLSGVGTPANNVNGGKAMGNSGFVGALIRILPGSDPLYLGMLIDDGTATSNGLELSNFQTLTADGEFHLYQWSLDEDGSWTNFSGGNGVIDGPNAFIDSLYFSSTPNNSAGGTNWAGKIWIDAVAYNPNGRLDALVPEPTSMATLAAFASLPALRRRRNQE